MLSQHALSTLTQLLGSQLRSANDLASGVKLADAVNAIFYEGTNETFANKIIRDKEDRKGNNIINMNMILKQIQKDQNIQSPPQIKSLTSFSITEDTEKLIRFTQWVVQQHQKLNKPPVEQDKQKIEDDAFENIYFGVQLSPERNQVVEEPVWQTDKVVKKGSFKIIRPKQLSIEQTFKHSPEGLKERKIVQNQQIKEQQDKDLSPRKTVLKMIEKPPMYRQSKQKTKVQKQKMEGIGSNSNFLQSPAPFSYERRASSNEKSEKQSAVKQFQNIHKKNISLQRDIMDISYEIDKHQQQQSQKRKSSSKRMSSSAKKLFKVDIYEVMEWQKKQIMQWLVSTNLLSIQITKNYQELHQICKNGVIFPEIINRNKGRGTDVSYFKNPKRPAQINANYQKVFNYLKQLPTFSSELTFLYEYFVPEAQERAFWSLLRSTYKCFSKKVPSSNNQTKSIYSRESQIKQKMKRPKSMSSSKKLSNSEKKEPEYEKVKYGNNSSVKERKKSQKIITKPSIQFIKEMPDKMFKHEELIQKEEPVEFGLVSHGYKQLHEMKRNYTANTPKKRSNDTSLTRSRIVSMNSIKKSGEKLNIPSVNLEMEMKALKYLKQKKYLQFFEREDKELFKDPVRNGVLLNEIIKNELQKNQAFNKRPKNIEDCRQNFRIALKIMKKQVIQLPLAYQHHTEEIIKGEISLFYGLVWYIIWNKNIEKQKGIQGNLLAEKPKLFEPDNTEQNILMWIRALQQNNAEICKLRIRDSRSLQNSIINSNLLFKIASVLIQQKYVLKPTYEQPINSVEQEANLRKILSFFMQNKVLKHEYVWKIKNIVKRDRYIINNLMNDLMSYYMSKNSHSEDSQRVTFMKYMRKNSNENRNYERLQTTMANQSFGNNIIENKQENIVPVEPIEVGWMRKLGFEGDLSINNGIILCQLISRFTMQTIVGVKESPQTKAQCRTNIRKAIKQISKFKWDEDDIFQADRQTTLEIYKFLKDKYRHSYAMKSAL